MDFLNARNQSELYLMDLFHKEWRKLRVLQKGGLKKKKHKELVRCRKEGFGMKRHFDFSISISLICPLLRQKEEKTKPHKAF